MISGIGGNVKIKGFTVIWIDLDQCVNLQHTVLVCDIAAGYDALLGNPFLARIDPKVGMRYNFWISQSRSSPSERRYLGNRHMAEVMFGTKPTLPTAPD